MQAVRCALHDLLLHLHAICSVAQHFKPFFRSIRSFLFLAVALFLFSVDCFRSFGYNVISIASFYLLFIDHKTLVDTARTSEWNNFSVLCQK